LGCPDIFLADNRRRSNRFPIPQRPNSKGILSSNMRKVKDFFWGEKARTAQKVRGWF